MDNIIDFKFHATRKFFTGRRGEIDDKIHDLLIYLLQDIEVDKRIFIYDEFPRDENIYYSFVDDGQFTIMAIIPRKKIKKIPPKKISLLYLRDICPDVHLAITVQTRVYLGG